MNTLRNLLLLIIGLPIIGFFGLQFYIQYKVTEGIDAGLARYSLAVEYESVDVSIIDKTIRVEGLSVTGDEAEQDIYIESMGVTELAFKDFIALSNAFSESEGVVSEYPHKLTGFIYGMKLNVENSELAVSDEETLAEIETLLAGVGFDAKSLYLSYEQLRDLGLSELTIDYDLGYSYNAERNVLSVHLTVAEGQLYKVKTKVVTDFDPSNVLEVRETLRELIISSLSIEYEDYGYVNYLYELAAVDRNLPIEELKLYTKVALDELLILKWDWSELDDESLVALHSFIQEPETITVTVDPSRSFKLKDLPFYESNDIPGLLNLSLRN